MLFTDQGRSVNLFRCALVGETVRLEGMARGGAVGVGAVVGVDVAHGFGLHDRDRDGPWAGYIVSGRVDAGLIHRV